MKKKILLFNGFVHVWRSYEPEQINGEPDHVFDIRKKDWQHDYDRIDVYPGEGDKMLSYVTKNWPEPLRLHDHLIKGIDVSDCCETRINCEYYNNVSNYHRCVNCTRNACKQYAFFKQSVEGETDLTKIFEDGFSESDKKKILEMAITTAAKIMTSAAVMCNSHNFMTGDVIYPDGSIWKLTFEKQTHDENGKQ